MASKNEIDAQTSLYIKDHFKSLCAYVTQRMALKFVVHTRLGLAKLETRDAYLAQQAERMTAFGVTQKKAEDFVRDAKLVLATGRDFSAQQTKDLIFSVATHLGEKIDGQLAENPKNPVTVALQTTDCVPHEVSEILFAAHVNFRAAPRFFEMSFFIDPTGEQGLSLREQKSKTSVVIHGSTCLVAEYKRWASRPESQRLSVLGAEVSSIGLGAGRS